MVNGEAKVEIHDIYITDQNNQFMASSKAVSPEDYISELPEGKQEAVKKLRMEILDNLPDGFTEIMGYGMIGYVVPLSLYPKGYHCDPKLPLPFINLAAQKNHIAIYHMGLYADHRLLDWFLKAHEKTGLGKPDIGKSCIRFKDLKKIPFTLIGELASKMPVNDWIAIYEKLR